MGRQTGRTFALIDNDLEHKLPPEFNFSNLEVIGRHKLYSPWEKNIMVGTVHRPPYRNFSIFLKKFNDIVSKISKDNKQFYVMGDFNLDPPSIYNHHMPTQEFIVSLFSHAFLPPIF